MAPARDSTSGIGYAQETKSAVVPMTDFVSPYRLSNGCLALVAEQATICLPDV